MAIFSEALDQPSEDRENWVERACARNAALLARVQKLLRADTSDARLLRTGGAATDQEDAPLPPKVGAYRISGLIGQGGMGAVYEGRRDTEDFEHIVAIKVVRPGALSDALVERFQHERRILASLNHPHIARLYDGGQAEDGSPYIVMERVDGAPITDWADEQELGRPARLSLFADLCDAVRHAHQHLVIHRDITPANVLVTPDGYVKLIDFGIAKPTAEQEETSNDATVASMSYTPGFAAPERTSGTGANTLSDIYSLGRVLSALLDGDQMDADLLAIIGKATAEHPKDRYASVDGLMDDLTNYQSGYAVSARNGGTAYRIGKYLSRHRIGVTAAAAAAIALIGGLITMTTLYNVASENRRAADARFNDVRELATFMMFDLYDEMEKVTGNTKAISMLADESQSYLDSLSGDTRASLDVQLEASRGYKRLADIIGNPKNANLGRRGEAGEMLESALTQAQAIHAAYPTDPRAIRTLGEVAFSLSTHVYVSSDENQRAHDLAALSAEMYRQLAQRPDASFDDHRQHVRATMMSGVPLPWMDRDAEGIEILQDALAAGEALVAAYPEEAEAKLLLGSINVELARALVRQAQKTEIATDSLPYWDEAVRLRYASYEAEPDNTKPYRSLVTIHYERGAVLRAEERLDEALAEMEKSRSIAEELLARDPEDAWLKRMLGGVQDEQAKTLSFAGDHNAAIAAVRAAERHNSAEIEASPDDTGLMREWAYSLALYADIYFKAGMNDEGCARTARSRAQWDRLAEQHPLSEHDVAVSIAALEELEAQCSA
ncbi:MAG: serine/threonine-protein kinase [Pseudomonadota bacterium]|nr:serine/threonine-protein kinase [Pseudomonadota bacterium]